MSKKVRANREFENIFELASYLNYYFSKNADASISMNDIKKIVDNNPNFSMEEPTIGNTALRPIISDNEGHTLMLEMKPCFVVYEDDCFNEDPPKEDESNEDDENDEDEEPEEEPEPEPKPEPEPEDGPDPDYKEEEKTDEPEKEEVDEEGRRIDKNIMEAYDWVKPGEEFIWFDPDTDTEVPVVCDTIVSVSGKVQSDTTEITVHRRDENQDEKFNIFCDEIVMEPEDEDENKDEESEEDGEVEDVKDAEVVDNDKEDEE